MAHATMNVTKFFERYKRAFLKMAWMVAYDPKGTQGTAQWYITAETRQDEIDVLSSGEKYEQKEGSSMASYSGSSDGDNADEVERSLSGGELENLMRDAYEEEAPQKTEVFREAAEKDADKELADRATLTPPIDHSTKHLLGLSNWSRKTKVSYFHGLLLLNGMERG